MKERLPIINKLLKRNPFPRGDSLCYNGELDDHFQIPVDPYKDKLLETTDERKKT